jgi:enoyl-CoA hydratase/carnithine racemase
VCDVLLCDDTAQFSIPEMERDIPPLLVMSALTGRVPPKTIAHLVLSLEQIDAQAALRAGLVSKVVGAGELDAEVQRLTETLTARSVTTLRTVKQFMQQAPEMTQAGASAFAANLAAVGLSAKF